MSKRRLSVTLGAEQTDMPTGLIRRNGRYSTRRVIPLDLQAVYGRREIVRALGTSDPAEARKRHAEAWVILEREFDAQRQKLQPAAQQEPKEIDTPFLASRILANLRKERDEAARGGRLEAFLERQRDQLAYRRGVLETGEDFGGQTLAVSDAAVMAINALLTGEGAAALSVAAPNPSRRTGKGTPLSTVIDRWGAEQTPTPRTVTRTRNIVDRFEAVNGKLSVEAVTKQHVLAFKDALIEQGQTPANINVMLPMLGTVFNYAIDKLHLIQTNPAAKVRVADKRKSKEKRRAFDEAELATIFASPIYTEHQRPAAGGGEAAYWLPLLGLYTGARLTELGQLHPDDVTEESYREADGEEKSAWVIRIVENADRGQRVKNEGSERRVPVHSDLIALGFITFAQEAKAKGQARLFPDIVPNASGELMGNWSKWFGRYRRALGIKGKDTPFHSFRHTFKHFARAAFIPNDVHNELTGHETGDVADSYGGLSYPLAPLVAGMAKYRVPGLRLPKPP